METNAYVNTALYTDECFFNVYMMMFFMLESSVGPRKQDLQIVVNNIITRLIC